MTVASTAEIVTAAAWSSLRAFRSLSTTSVVTCSSDDSTTMASPLGTARPLLMLTAVTTPSIGALSVPRAIWAMRSFRDCAACETWFCAL